MKKILFTALVSSALFISCGGRTNANTNPGKGAKADVQSVVTTVNLTKADFLEKIVNYERDIENWNYLGDKPAIVDFYASWCGPCKTVAPILEELAAEYKDDIVIYKVNIDKEQELAGVFGIRSIPTFLFIPMEGQPQLVSGALKKDKFEEIIEDLLLQEPQS